MNELAKNKNSRPHDCAVIRPPRHQPESKHTNLMQAMTTSSWTRLLIGVCHFLKLRLMFTVFAFRFLWVWRLHVPISQSVSSICRICYFYTIFPFMCLQLFCLELELPAKPFIYFGHIQFLNILQIWCIVQLIERIHKTLYTQHFALQQKI